MDLQEIVEQCRQDSIDWFGEETAANLNIFALGLAGESGEFCDEVKKLMRGSQTMEEAYPKLGEELIDVFIYVCSIAALMHFDLEEIYHDKRAINVGRFGGDFAAGVRSAEGEPVGEG